MDHASDYNVDGSLLGLGENIFLELLSEMELPQDEQKQGTAEGNKFIHSDQDRYCTIAIDPVITEGIVKLEVVFENTGGWSIRIGIADASCSFAAGKGPCGELDHITEDIIRNQIYADRQRIAVEVDMTAIPRRATFFVDDIEQPNFVIGIPKAIRFWAFTFNKSSSFTVTKFERLIKSTAKGVEGSKALKWGKSWK